MSAAKKSDRKVRVTISLDEELLEAIDRIADEMGFSRSDVFSAAVDSGLDNLKLLGFLGFTPRRLGEIGRILADMKVFKSKGLVIDFAAKAAEFEQG